MPGFDGTGPAFQGPRTGWGRGRCAPAGVQEGNTDESTGAPGIVYGAGRGGVPRGCGRGFCGGRGQGRGRR